ncbi:MAG: nucleotidyl transferase AbiEii/AbiGii toxin family protein [Boseongicola sp.]|nr:nucleotidyl transferase AbiEii/AbiGii toxin family protein [Boseongicola sp.]
MRHPDWEKVVSAAARLQRHFPDAVLVGGTAASLHAGHRFSRDADHVLTDLRERFDEVLADLESVAGCKTARIRPPVLILGSLDGIETGVRQLVRSQTLETVELSCNGEKVVVPSLAETLRIKAVLILKRNALRDHVDFAALASSLGHDGTVEAMSSFDRLYPQENGQSATQQLLAQLANPLPGDLGQEGTRTFRGLAEDLQDWGAVRDRCKSIAVAIFDGLSGPESRDESPTGRKPAQDAKGSAGHE